jgi:phosphoribosylaminoimidazole-succinocarboxamide synthase
MIQEEVKHRLSGLTSPTAVMEVQILRVIRPELKEGHYDYSAYRDLYGNFLIPLEIIYRNSLPEGSSVFKRLQSGQLSLQDLDLEKMPEPGQALPRPIFDVSTKLEVTDRYISWQEAMQMAGLRDDELEEIKDTLMRINSIITEEYARIGLKNEDGKIELGFGPERKLMVVDVLGTPDECRFTYQGIPVSKEIARIYYRKTPWYQEVEEAKKKDRQNWKSLVKNPPEPLPPRLKELIGFVYQGCANELTGRQWFKGVPPLKEVLEEVREYI